MTARLVHVSEPLAALPQSLRTRAIELRTAGDTVGAANLEIAAATIENGDAVRGRAIAYEPTAILTIEQVAAWLQMGIRSVERLNLPCVYLGTRTRRYVARDVLDYLERRKSA